MSLGAYTEKFGNFDADSIQKSAVFNEEAKVDTISAKLEPGELIVNPRIYADPEMRPHLEAIFAKMVEKGQNPLAMIAGMKGLPNDMGGQYDPMAVGPEGTPGNEQQFFFKSIWKAIKKIAKNPIIRTIATIAATAVNPIFGAAVSGGLTKAGGGSWGQAIGNAAGSYFGSTYGAQSAAMGGGVAGNTVKSALSNVPTDSWYSGISNSLSSGLPDLIGGINIGQVIGSNLGAGLGTALGGMIDPQKLPVEMLVNTAGDRPLPTVQPMTNTSTLNLGLGSGQNSIYGNSNLTPINQGFSSGPSGANVAGSDLGAWGSQTPEGVSYVRRMTNRQGNSEDEEVGTFGSMLDRNNRRFSLAANTGNNGAGVLYY